MEWKTGFLLVALILALMILSAGCLQTPDGSSAPGPAPGITDAGSGSSTPAVPYDFGIPKKSAHYVRNSPAHGATLTELPVEVSLDFNFVLGPGSVISIRSGGREWGAGETTIDPGRLTMRRSLNLSAPDGLYEVVYDACWPDGSCHDGNFRFAVNRSRPGQPLPPGTPAPGSITTAMPATTPGLSGPGISPDFGIPKKSPHYETNTPEHGAVLAGVPVNVVIDFNFDLGPGSAISVKSGSREYATGTTGIDPNRLAMRRPIDPAAPDGLYEVTYNACWPDGSCHDGNFRFAIDRSLARQYTDLTGTPQVTINMDNIAFDPAMVRVTRGTNVTWINREAVEHFVNTESHPAHTYYIPQNSRGLLKNDTFSVVFDTPGIYPYHCSAHAAVMRGSILVE